MIQHELNLEVINQIPDDSWENHSEITSKVMDIIVTERNENKLTPTPMPPTAKQGMEEYFKGSGRDFKFHEHLPTKKQVFKLLWKTYKMNVLGTELRKNPKGGDDLEDNGYQLKLLNNKQEKFFVKTLI